MSDKLLSIISEYIVIRFSVLKVDKFLLFEAAQRIADIAVIAAVVKKGVHVLLVMKTGG